MIFLFSLLAVISEEAVKTLGKYDKPYMVSLSGLSLKDNVEMLHRALQVPGIAAIELNLACPNIPGKPVIAYDFDQMDDVLSHICLHPDIQNGKKILGIKLAPYFDRLHVEKAVTIIIKYPVKFIVSINTIGNALFIDAETECVSICAKGGYGGLGGGYAKHTALANVSMLHSILMEKNRSNDIDIIGVGGVSSGTDVFELILCGARAVQIGTCHWNEGASCFARIKAELESIMKKKGYKTIDDFRGKLKSYEKHVSRVPIKGKTTAVAAVDGSVDLRIGATEDSLLPDSNTSVLLAIIALLVAIIIAQVLLSIQPAIC